MRLTYRRDTPANMVWEEINSETLAMHADTCKGVHAHTTHTCASSITDQTNKADFDPRKSFHRQSETKREEERRKAGGLRDGMQVREVLLTGCYYWQSISQTLCSVALRLCYI